jgi:hypothetical protein
MTLSAWERTSHGIVVVILALTGCTLGTSGGEGEDGGEDAGGGTAGSGASSVASASD